MAKFNAILAMNELVNRVNRNRSGLADQLNLLVCEGVITDDMNVAEVLLLLRKKVNLQQLIEAKSESVDLDYTIPFHWNGFHYLVKRDKNSNTIYCTDEYDKNWINAQRVLDNPNYPHPDFQRVLKNAIADLNGSLSN